MQLELWWLLCVCEWEKIVQPIIKLYVHFLLYIFSFHCTVMFDIIYSIYVWLMLIMVCHLRRRECILFTCAVCIYQYRLHNMLCWNCIVTTCDCDHTYAVGVCLHKRGELHNGSPKQCEKMDHWSQEFDYVCVACQGHYSNSILKPLYKQSLHSRQHTLACICSAIHSACGLDALANTLADGDTVYLWLGAPMTSNLTLFTWYKKCSIVHVECVKLYAWYLVQCLRRLDKQSG
jgi:hypothetical protein